MSKEKVILQALMSLDIGGAETHVIELTMELKRRGYRVIVVSNGGAYESILRENGIEVYNIPLHTKNPIAVLKSIKMLREIIKKENIKLVHAHARIPAFLLSLLKVSMDFNMITTAHGVFFVNAILKRITKWGDKVFAVSEDIREYLINNYDIDKENIYMTINGINLEKYKRNEKANDNNAIVHISRLEETTSLIARYLIEYGKLNEEQKIIIVGDGEQLDTLKLLAKGFDNIKLVGKSIDVTEYLEKAKIFVGISRSTLEAMCYNLPIILAGDYGYMGVLDMEKLQLASFNNFTARNSEEPVEEALFTDLDLLIDNIDKTNFLWEREFINNNYSVAKMADNYEEVYKLYLGD